MQANLFALLNCLFFDFDFRTGKVYFEISDCSFSKNLLWCIKKISKDLKLCISMHKEENKVISVLGGNSSALVLCFHKEL